VNGRQLRHRGGVAAALMLASAGVATQNGAILLAAAIPLVYVVYDSASTVSFPEELTAHRRIEPQPARPGGIVTVTLTVTNGSDRTVPDLRVADAVPEKLAVLAGSPRAAATLEPGDELVVRYQVGARRGEYPFDPPQLRLRGLGAAVVSTVRPPTTGEETLVCRLDADAPPIEDYGTGRVGTLTTDDPGQGLAFHSVREHRQDDPADRIDWRHYAKRGELATVNYEREVPGTVILVVDARSPNHVVAGTGRPTAVELQAYAATRAMTDLLRSGHDVGVAVLGLDGPGPVGLHWLPPGSGAEQRALALDRFRAALEAERARRDVDDQVHKLLELAPAGSQLTLFSPLLDDEPVGMVETWLAAGLPVTVLSVDVVPTNTVSGQYAGTRRRTRLADCQNAGARAFDWRRGTPLPLVIERAFAATARVPTARATGGGR